MHNNSSVASQQEIESRIFTFRSTQVMVDKDLAEIYGVGTKVLNQAVKRNINRFPDSFYFQLFEYEIIELVTNCDRFNNLKHSSAMPYAFTEQGIAMLSAILRSETAIKVSIQIMNAFVEMRKLIAQNELTDNRLDKLERKQLETEEKFDNIFKALERKDIKPDKGIFFDGQVFDAYSFVADLIRKAETSIILIDNYVDDTVLTLLCKRKDGVNVTLYTKSITKQLSLDIEKFNAQYPPIEIKELREAHDRFILIDNTNLYHIGASLKDLGKKWFAFSKMDTESLTLLNRLKK